MSAVDLLLQLHNATLSKPDTAVWGPAGTVSVTRCEATGDEVMLELIVPTDSYDCDDFVWKSELSAQTTDKFALFQEERAVPGAAVISIAREGNVTSEVPGENVYRLLFRVPASAVHPATHVALLCRNHEGLVVSQTGIGTASEA
jgi:hypothetical protein